MSMKVSVRSTDPAPATRALAWPVLEPGNGGFVNGVYSVSLSFPVPGRSLAIDHEVEGAPLITNWIEARQTQFACAVADPRSAYRRVHRADAPHQLIEWNPDDLGSHPRFTPMILSVSDIQHRVDAERDGLHPLWHGHLLQLTPGSRIAICSTFAFRAGLLGLLDFRLDEELKPGWFRLETSHEEGFKFKVHLARDLFAHLRFTPNRRELTGWNIMTHVVSAALTHLRDYASEDGEEGWRSFPNLVAFADWLSQKGMGHWSDDDFDPAFTATRLYRHRVPTEHGGEE